MATIPPRTIPLKDGSNVILRCMEERDAFASIELRLACAKTSPWIATRPEDVTETIFEQAAKIAKWRSSETELILCAQEASGALVGACAVLAPPRARLRHTVEVGLALLPHVRGRGLGRAMMTAMLEFAAAHPTIEKVCLGVVPANVEGIRLYHSLGFVEEGRQRGQFRQPETGIDHDHINMAVWVKPGKAPAGFKTWPLT